MNIVVWIRRKKHKELLDENEKLRNEIRVYKDKEKLNLVTWDLGTLTFVTHAGIGVGQVSLSFEKHENNTVKMYEYYRPPNSKEWELYESDDKPIITFKFRTEHAASQWYDTLRGLPYGVMNNKIDLSKEYKSVCAIDKA